MSIGLNATREICLRCPLAMGEDLLRDLAMYKTYKEKSVMMAARSLITLYREQLPALLHKKDRGRQSEAQAEHKVRAYGEVEVHETIPGAEALLKNSKTIDLGSDEDETNSQDGEWVDVPQSEDDAGSSDDEADEDDEEASSEEEVSSGTDQETQDDDNENKIENKTQEQQQSQQLKKSKQQKEQKKKSSKLPDNIKLLDEKEAAQELALTRIFTEEDFKRINAANLKKTVTNSRKRPLEQDRSEFVKLDAIEMIYKKRKHDKETRLDSVKTGRQDRDKFGWKDGRKNENCSKTNKEKRKHKNVVMMRLKARSKVKKSFKDKQQALRNHLLKQKKMK